MPFRWAGPIFRAAGSGAGSVEVRYGYSIAHLDTHTPPAGGSRVELLDGASTGSPPLANLAVRPRHEIAASWQPALLRARATRHQIAAGASWEISEPRNRFRSPSDSNLITANGAPAFIVEFNTPVDSTARVATLAGYAADHITAAALDLARPRRSGRLFTRLAFRRNRARRALTRRARNFAAQSGLIRWNSLSPRAGLAWQVPHSHGLVLRGAYSRRYAPLAGRYLDFGNPNSLAGSVYTPFQASQPGDLVLRFGGPYSSIAPALGRPYSDEFDYGRGIANRTRRRGGHPPVSPR